MFSRFSFRTTQAEDLGESWGTAEEDMFEIIIECLFQGPGREVKWKFTSATKKIYNESNDPALYLYG